MTSVLSKVKLAFSRYLTRSHINYSGPYQSWSLAEQQSVGYDSHVVLDKVTAATLDVLSGQSAYERDGTSFPNSPSTNTLSSILKTICTPDTSILDFGGGLGGTYINNRSILSTFGFKSYSVVEQTHFCTLGSQIAADYSLPIRFYNSLDNLDFHPTLIIFSGVLHYIDDWRSIVRSALSLRPLYILVDRQPFTNGATNIWIQNNTGYYDCPVTYPSRIINHAEFTSQFTGYEIVRAWESDFDPSDHLGYLFKLTLAGMA